MRRSSGGAKAGAGIIPDPANGLVCDNNRTYSQNDNPRLARSLSDTGRRRAGMHPLKSLPDRRSCSSLVSWPNSDGIEPLKSLLASVSHLRLISWPNSAGIEPLKALPDKYSAPRLVRLPNEEGIEPLKALLPRASACRLVRVT